MQRNLRFGALEAGGTKMVMSILDASGTILERQTMPSLKPTMTIPQMIAFFSARGISALGIGSFGPLDLNPASADYGHITNTPKLAWRHYPLLPTFINALGIPAALDTDVNAAALAEHRLGTARGLHSCLYVTVGTGVGGGLMVNDRCVHGLTHPELGHQLLAPVPDDPAPEGFCPYHRRCLEGLASGPAMMKRWGIPAQELPEDHPAWGLEADYLAQMCVNAMLTFSPEKIILGGGVMHQQCLMPMIREKTAALLNGYIVHPAVKAGLRDYIVSPGLGDNSGVLGAWLLAKQAYARSGKAE